MTRPDEESIDTKFAPNGGRRWRLARSSRVFPSSMPKEGDGTDVFDPGTLQIGKVYRRGRYISSQISLQVARYIRVRGDLLSLVANERLNDEKAGIYGDAKRCGDYLTIARNQLESRRPNLAVCTNVLTLAERQLVMLYPLKTLAVRFDMVRRLLEIRAARSEWVQKQLIDLRTYNSDEQDAARLRLQQAVITAFQIDEQDQLEDDLQVSRLRRLWIYMFASWVLLMGVMPFVTTQVETSQNTDNWPVFDLSTTWLTQIVAALGISVVGAVGGVISGMFGVRDARATLGDFRTSLLRLSLKPIAGAIAALVVYLFLSWQVISGIQVDSGGVYILAAFLAGFSERYFLRILHSEELQKHKPENQEKQKPEKPRRTRTTPASPGPSSHLAAPETFHQADAE